VQNFSLCVGLAPTKLQCAPIIRGKFAIALGAPQFVDLSRTPRKRNSFMAKSLEPDLPANR
jgi:hypothetical protein